MYDLFVASKAAIALQLKMLQNTNFFCSLTNYSVHVGDMYEGGYEQHDWRGSAVAMRR